MIDTTPKYGYQLVLTKRSLLLLFFGVLLLILAAETFAESDSSNTGATSGTFAHTPLDGGIQLHYSIKGLSLSKPEDTKPSFTTSRTYKIVSPPFPGSIIAISGSSAPAKKMPCNSDYGSFWLQTEVSLTVDGKTKTYSSPKPCTKKTEGMYYVSQASGKFNISMKVPNKTGVTASFSIRQTYVNPRFGDRSVVVLGTMGQIKPVTQNPPKKVEAKDGGEDRGERSKIADSGVRFSGLNGQVEYKNPDMEDWAFAELSTVLFEKAIIRTEDESSAVLSFTDMSTFVLKANSSVVVSTKGGRTTKIDLLIGNLVVNFKKMIRGGSMAVKMNQGLAGTKGTIFSCTEQGGISKVEVLEGVVLFTSIKDGRSVDVAGGNMASVNSRGILMTDVISNARMEELAIDLRKYRIKEDSEDSGTKATANAAFNKPTSQSSTDYGGTSERAVDGNTSGIFHDGSVTHTNSQPGVWWQVDLQNRYDIEEIVIYNRTDCCGERLSDFFVFVSDSPFQLSPIDLSGSLQGIWQYHYKEVAPQVLTIPVSHQGRYVRIQLAGSNYLSLAEVQVMTSSGIVTEEEKVNNNKEDGMVYKKGQLMITEDSGTEASGNAALKKTTVQSSTEYSGTPERAGTWKGRKRDGALHLCFLR